MVMQPGYVIYAPTALGQILRGRVPEAHIAPILKWIYNTVERSTAPRTLRAPSMRIVALRGNSWVGPPDEA
jgi:hypothetical protein